MSFVSLKPKTNSNTPKLKNPNENVSGGKGSQIETLYCEITSGYLATAVFAKETLWASNLMGRGVAGYKYRALQFLVYFIGIQRKGH